MTYGAATKIMCFLSVYFAALAPIESSACARRLHLAAVCALCASLRWWCHPSGDVCDQNRMRIRYGRCGVGVCLVFKWGSAWIATREGTTVSAISAITVRFVGGLFIALQGCQAVDFKHRLAMEVVWMLAALIYDPTYSDLGRSKELSLVFVALFFGEIVGSRIEKRLYDHKASVESAASFSISEQQRHKINREFAAHHFQSNADLYIALGMTVMLVCLIAYHFFDYGAERNIVTVLAIVVGLIVRINLCYARDVARARTLWGRCFVAMTLIWNTSQMLHSVATPIPISAFLLSRVLIQLAFFVHAVQGLDFSHRAASLSVFVITSVMAPSFSEVGRPLEPLITSFCALIGDMVGNAIYDTLQRLYREQKFQKLLREEVQVREQEALEQQREAEAARAKERLRNAEVNRDADSNLNHVVKGKCGEAIMNLTHLLDGSSPGQLDGHTSEVIRNSVVSLRQAIEWTHNRQVHTGAHFGNNSDPMHTIASAPTLFVTIACRAVAALRFHHRGHTHKRALKL